MSAGWQQLYCCVYQTKKQNIFRHSTGHDGQISAAISAALAADYADRPAGYAAASIVIASASEAIHGRSNEQRVDCFVAFAPRNDADSCGLAEGVIRHLRGFSGGLR